MSECRFRNIKSERLEQSGRIFENSRRIINYLVRIIRNKDGFLADFFLARQTLDISVFIIVTTGIFSPIALAENEVGITRELSYLDVIHEGKKIRIERIQDTSHKLTNSFSKTSRPCPPFCIQPAEMHPDIKTVGETELLTFLDTEVRNNQGLLIDARMPAWFEKGTIPGSVNIPFTILSDGLVSPHTRKIIKLLGAKETEGKWDFSNTRKLLLFCNGPWCGQSPRAIKNLLKLGYPPSHIYWYRGGMQSWQLLGLTTVMP
jgi:rhodanese-related sulfurtransferase